MGKGFPIKDKTGMYIEKPDLISKYERRKLVENDDDEDGDHTLSYMCYSQFAKMYQPRGSKFPGKDDHEGGGDTEEGDLNDDDICNYVITGVNDGEK